jgi:hypothetical protein
VAFLWLPEARRVEHDRGLTFTDAGEPKGVLHTTESPGRPSYDGWTVHPHMTVVPVPKTRVDVDQHIPFSHAGMALRNLAGGVQTNRDRAYQIELVGTSALGGPGYYWATADDVVLLDLWRKVIHPMSVGLAIPVKALDFQAYPSSYGDRRPDGRTNMVRLSEHEWDVYSGWLGHQHVPENIHGDPGAFPWARMIRLAEAAGDISRDEPRVPPKPAPGGATVAPRFPLPAGYYFGPRDPLSNVKSVSGYFSHAEDLKTWQTQMKRRTWRIEPTGRYDEATRRVVLAFQKEKGLSVTGHIHPATWIAAWTKPVTKG